MVMCLEDLINYFAQPEDDMGMELVLSTLQAGKKYLDVVLQNTRRNRIDLER